MFDNPVLLQAVQRVAERKSSEPRTRFRATYRDDPAAFVHDCIRWRPGEGPTSYQDEILDAIPKHRRVCVRGPRGLGKSSLSSWAILWFALTRDGEDWKIPTTAGAWRQLTKFLWPEIHKWARRLDWSKIPRQPFDFRTELLTQNLKLATGEAFAVASDTPDLIEGAHADCLLYVFDECKSISNQTFDAAEGTLTGGKKVSTEAFALAVSTPGDKTGRFYDIQSHKPGYEDWWPRHVRLDEVVSAGRLDMPWVEQRRKQWGQDSPIFQSQVLGEFPEQGSDALISLAWVDDARQREFEPVGPKLAGCDIARWGEDFSVELVVQDAKMMVDGVETIHQGGCVVALDNWNGADLMQTTGRIKAAGIYAAIDSIGVGSGVYDRLQEQGFACDAVNVGTSAEDSEHFFNLRAELYWRLREDFRDGKIDLTRLSEDDYNRLSGELTNIKYEYTSKGQIKIEPKDDMKKRRDGESPDYADALMLTRSGRNTGIGIHII